MVEYFSMSYLNHILYSIADVSVAGASDQQVSSVVYTSAICALGGPRARSGPPGPLKQPARARSTLLYYFHVYPLQMFIRVSRPTRYLHEMCSLIHAMYKKFDAYIIHIIKNYDWGSKKLALDWVGIYQAKSWRLDGAASCRLWMFILRDLIGHGCLIHYETLAGLPVGANHFWKIHEG